MSDFRNPENSFLIIKLILYEPRREKTHFSIYAKTKVQISYIDSTIPLLFNSEIASLKSSSVAVQPNLCRTWSETSKTGSVVRRLIWTINIFAIIHYRGKTSWILLWAEYNTIKLCNSSFDWTVCNKLYHWSAFLTWSTSTLFIWNINKCYFSKWCHSCPSVVNNFVIIK